MPEHSGARGLLGEALGVVGADGDPVRLVLMRLAQGRPEDAGARAAVGRLLAPRDRWPR